MHPQYQVPHHAELALVRVVCALVLTIDLRGAIGFSSFGVLLYYTATNAAAFPQNAEQRRSRVSCRSSASSAASPWSSQILATSILSGVAVFVVGIAYRLCHIRRT